MEGEGKAVTAADAPGQDRGGRREEFPSRSSHGNGPWRGWGGGGRVGAVGVAGEKGRGKGPAPRGASRAGPGVRRGP